MFQCHRNILYVKKIEVIIVRTRLLIAGGMLTLLLAAGVSCKGETGSNKAAKDPSATLRGTRVYPQWTTRPYLTKNSYDLFYIYKKAVSAYAFNHGRAPSSLRELEESSFLVIKPEVEGLTYTAPSDDEAVLSFNAVYYDEGGALRREKVERKIDLLKNRSGAMPSGIEQIGDLSKWGKYESLNRKVSDRRWREMNLKAADGDEKKMLCRQRLFVFKEVMRMLLLHWEEVNGEYPASLEEMLDKIGPKVDKAWWNEYARRPMKNSEEYSIGDYYYKTFSDDKGNTWYKLSVHIP